MTLVKIINLWPPFEFPATGIVMLAVQDAYVSGAIQQSGYMSAPHPQDAIQSGASVQDAN